MNGTFVAATSPLAGVSASRHDGSSAKNHASILNRVIATRAVSHGEQLLLGLQRHHGNRYVQRVLALAKQEGDKAKIAPAVEYEQEADRVARQVLNTPDAAVALQRTGVQQAASRVQRQGQVTTPAAKFSDMTVIAGGLAPGKPRTPQALFRGDTVKFSATCENISPGEVEAGLDGRVVGKANPPQMGWNGNVLSWQVTVGNMGAPAKPGEAPQDVDAKPWMRIVAPALNAGAHFENAYSFKVVADLQWLADRADIAGQQIDTAYLDGVKLLKNSFAPYKEAYQAHKKALEARERRQQVADDILMGVFFAALGGAAGGAMQQLIRGESKELIVIAGATAGGDVTKYIVRLGAGKSGGSGAGHGTETPGVDPTAGKGSATGGVGFEPDVWLAGREAAFAAEGSKAKQACVDLKLALSEAWAAGKTALMDQDPVDIIAPYAEELKTPLPVKSPQEYAAGLWRNWLTQYYFVIDPQSRAGGYAMHERSGGGGDKLLEDVKAQCGSDAVVNEVQKAQQAKADKMQRAWFRGRPWCQNHPDDSECQPL